MDANAAAAAAADEPAAAGGAAVGATVTRTGAFLGSAPPTGAGVTRVAPPALLPTTPRFTGAFAAPGPAAGR